MYPERKDEKLKSIMVLIGLICMCILCVSFFILYYVSSNTETDKIVSNFRVESVDTEYIEDSNESKKTITVDKNSENHYMYSGRFECVESGYFDNASAAIVVDTETGVLYIRTAYGICPLYNSDGSLQLYDSEK